MSRITSESEKAAKALLSEVTFLKDAGFVEGGEVENVVWAFVYFIANTEDGSLLQLAPDEIKAGIIALIERHSGPEPCLTYITHSSVGTVDSAPMFRKAKAVLGGAQQTVQPDVPACGRSAR